MLRRFADAEALAEGAADEVAKIVRTTPGTVHIALSGGSTPKRMFEVLAARGRGALAWDRVELWWGDERTVPPDHEDSNYGMAKRALIDPLGIKDDQIHRMHGEDPPAAAAEAYEKALVGALGAPPRFDLVLLGLGPDGHTASLFPGSPALAERQRWVVANPVTSPLAGGSTTRLTLTAPAINTARAVRFVVAGADKSAAVAMVLDGARDPVKYPAQLVDGAHWLIDKAAAAQLRGIS